MKTRDTTAFRFASIGEVSHGTLRTQDLLERFLSELEWQVQRNGGFLALPENRAMRDRMANVIGKIQDAFAEDGETLKNEREASELLYETVFDALNEFAAPYCVFSASEWDGASFGFWPDIESAKEGCGFVSSEGQEWPDDDFRGEWLHVNERGNCTLYVRESVVSDSVHCVNAQHSHDREIWSIV